jgi:hypothetical protein
MRSIALPANPKSNMSADHFYLVLLGMSRDVEMGAGGRALPAPREDMLFLVLATLGTLWAPGRQHDKQARH